MIKQFAKTNDKAPFGAFFVSIIQQSKAGSKKILLPIIILWGIWGDSLIS